MNIIDVTINIKIIKANALRPCTLFTYQGVFRPQLSSLPNELRRGGDLSIINGVIHFGHDFTIILNKQLLLLAPNV